MKKHMPSQRIKWIDIARGIGIILVVLGHRGEIFKTDLISFIYSFHMPLFFFLSGYVFCAEHYLNFKEFFKKKFLNLIVPYLSFSLISLFAFGIGKQHINIKEFFINTIYSTDGLINVPLWFLTCLFVIELLYFSFNKLLTQKWEIILALLVCSVIGYFSNKIFSARPPFSIDVALYSIVFYGAGNLIRGIRISNQTLTKKIAIASLSLIANLFLSTYLLGDSVVITKGVSLNIFIGYYIAAFMGIAFIVLVSQCIKNYRVLPYLGKNSIIILATHMLIFHFIGCAESRLKINFTANNLLMAIIYTLITIIISLPVISVIQNYFPFVIGKKYSQRSVKINRKTAV